MTELADLYIGFASQWIDTSAGQIFARLGGRGPPLLLLHGYAQTNVMWHKVAPILAPHFTLVLADLPGYGWSAVPDADAAHAPYTKRAMASAMIDLMERLGFARFRMAGHDRGGRVGYRLALDHPGRLEQLAVLDIVPTFDIWQRMDRKLAFRMWHWLFLALPAPFPETMIGHDPVAFLDAKMAKQTKSKDLSPFDPRALAHYRAFFCDPLRLHATCEDYRAGQTTDLAIDREDRKLGKKISCPLLAIWGSAGNPSDSRPLDVWREWATDVRGFPIDSGHFLCEENAEATGMALLDFFSAG
jgi:haloacetate dehalogenase